MPVFANKKLKKIIGDSNGQAIIEFVLMLPLIVIIMMFLIITYNLISEMITVHENLRFEVRKAVASRAPSYFKRVFKEEWAAVEVPGRMKYILNRTLIRKKLTLESYGGCYHGLYINKFRKWYLYRQIM